MSLIESGAPAPAVSGEPTFAAGVVVFGASEMGRRVLAQWPAACRPVAALVDNDPQKWGTRVGGLAVHPPHVLHEIDRYDLLVVVASAFYDDIVCQLTEMGFTEGIDFVPAGRMHHHRALARPAGGPRRAVAATGCVLRCSWFEFDWSRFDTVCKDADVRVIPAPTVADDARAAVTPTADTCATMRHQGVPLMAACAYDICVSLRVPIERLDPGVPEHWAAIVEHVEHAAAIVDVAAQALDRMRPDVMVIPQGYTKVAAVYRYLAVLRGIRVVALENSLNRHRLMWDDVAGLAVNRVVARNYFWRWEDLVDSATAAAHVRWYLSSIKTLKQSQHESPDRAWQRPVNSGPTVLFLANVLTDSSVMFNSRVGSQAEAIKAAARWSLEHGCTFVLKVHPRERPGHYARYDGLTVSALQEDEPFWRMVSGSDRFVLDGDNHFDTYDLIRRSDVCVTTCSQAGLEALMMGKETVVLGDAYYGGLGFTHEVHDRAQIGSGLAAALDPSARRVDPDRIARFFYVLDRIYCVEKSERGVLDVLLRTLGRAPLAVPDGAQGR